MALRKSKKVSNFPPNPAQWKAERNGLDFRQRFGITADVPLRPFDFETKLPGVRVLRRRDLEQRVSSTESLAQAFGPSNDKWSGVTILLGTAGFAIILNDNHAQTRQHATLMEEYFHIILRHQPTVIAPCPLTGHMARQYQKDQEEEAYWSAAAALVPYATLRSWVTEGMPPTRIALHFEVSDALVMFRLKVTKLWRLRAG